MVIAALLMIVVGSLLVYAYFAGAPPEESKLIANFDAHRGVYEQLREMLIADQDLRHVAPWGVETSQSKTPQPSPTGLPSERYQEYLRLLKEIGAAGADRSDGVSPEVICIGQWGSGFGGDTRHVDICWVKNEPSHQAKSS